jgi:hypothetical protein
MTDKPCEGCGQGGGRPIGQVCRDCRELLTEAKANRRAASLRVNLVPMNVPFESWPSFVLPIQEDARLDYNDRMSKRLERTLHAVCAPLWQVVPWKAIHDRMPMDERGRYRLSPPDLLSHDAHYSYRHTRTNALIDPALIEPIRQLDALIREVAKAAYDNGVDRGSSLLSQLAAGTISPEDFNKKTVLQDAGAKVRRQYKEE